MLRLYMYFDDSREMSTRAFILLFLFKDDRFQIQQFVENPNHVFYVLYWKLVCLALGHKVDALEMSSFAI